MNNESTEQQGTVVRTVPIPEGPHVPGYRIEKELGKGGMGAVYLGFDKKLKRKVAIKTILGTYAADPDFRRRFEDEGRRHAQLNHPNILRIYGSGEDDDALYLIMEFADSGNLADRLEDGPLPAREVAAIIMNAARGLEHAHKQDPPLVHLDIKPENLLVSDNRVMVSDFGIAKRLATSAQPGTTIAGDPRYWPPEQQENRPQTKSDIYALGMVFFELLTGERPKKKIITSNKDRDQLLKALPKNAKKYGPLIARCLNLEPDARPSAAELAEELGNSMRARSPRLTLILLAALVAALTTYLIIDDRYIRYYETVQIWLFPPEQVEVRFDIAPAIATLAIDGIDKPFRDFLIAEGDHSAAVVAEGYIGRVVDFSISADDGAYSTTIRLIPRPPITDLEYRNFATQFNADADVDAMLAQNWTDPTLLNVLYLEKMMREDSPDIDAFIEDQILLTVAGDEVAQTTLYYASLEELPPYGNPGDYVTGLDNASNKDYALATILQALHLLNEIQLSDKTLAEDAATRTKLGRLAQKAKTQGMPQTGALVELQIQQAMDSAN